jgi:rSAM/selenodomain-associated transferase 2
MDESVRNGYGMSDATFPALSIIVPCLNEAAGIAAALDALVPLRARGAEVIVVDGGSSDATLPGAAGRADLILESPPGRAVQMNAGAARARGEVLLFLHADTRLPQHADALIREGLARSGLSWGRFDVTISGRHALFPLIAAAINARSRLTGIATGDQAMFVTRALFERAGRYREIALMEDVALSAALRRRGPPLCIAQPASTSGRRWEKHGVVSTVLLMWRLRLAYALGADPDKLAGRYVSHH